MKKTPPTQVREVVVLRTAGYTQPAIAQRTGLSLATIGRILKRTGATAKDSEKELVSAAREQMRLAFRNEAVQNIYCEAIADTLAHIGLAREKAAEAVEALSPTDTDSAALTLRGLAAHSVLMKNHVDTLRDLLPRPTDEQSLPELIIREMSPEEVEAVRNQQQSNMMELGYDDGDSEENEVVELAEEVSE